MLQHRDNRRTSGTRRGSGLTERLARTSAMHPWRTIGLWTLLVAGRGVRWRAAGKGITSDMEFRAAKPDSVIGQELVEQRLTGPRQ